MKCPYCSVGIKLETKTIFSGPVSETDYMNKGIEVECGYCPECENPILLLTHGLYFSSTITFDGSQVVGNKEIIFPPHIGRKIEPEIPDIYKKEFLEACAVLPVSSKASAALSRRLLQKVLREKFNIKCSNLASEIDEFIRLKDIPSHLAEAVDAIRNIGNFAAHPLKNTNTGEIVDVEPGEAEWLLDVLENLFDFSFVQPIRRQRRKNALNAKLGALGKPPMKS